MIYGVIILVVGTVVAGMLGLIGVDGVEGPEFGIPQLVLLGSLMFFALALLTGSTGRRQL